LSWTRAVVTVPSVVGMSRAWKGDALAVALRGGPITLAVLEQARAQGVLPALATRDDPDPAVRAARLAARAQAAPPTAPARLSLVEVRAGLAGVPVVGTKGLPLAALTAPPRASSALDLLLLRANDHGRATRALARLGLRPAPHAPRPCDLVGEVVLEAPG